MAPYEADRPEDVKKDGIHRMPSDHIGLVCDIRLPQKNLNKNDDLILAMILSLGV